jgi:predicted ATP-grasp superfamily ATP-dependent carboligase
MWSRFATSTFLTEDPSANAHVFARQIAEELEARYASCALVGTDDAYWALSRFRELLPIAARRILPPHYSVVRSLDHEALHYFAESLGISCAPLIRVPDHAPVGEVLELINGLSFPLLLRPIIPWIEREDGTRRANKRMVVRSKEELLLLLDARSTSGSNGFLVSAYTTKRMLSYFGVADRGNVVVEGFQERLNEAEPYSEVATLSATINPVTSIRRSSQLLLDALQWQGPFKLEYMRDHRGQYRLISLIGRLWGSLQLAISAKMNIPLICYRMAQGTLTKAIMHNATPNVRVRWLIGDVLAKVANPRHSIFHTQNWTALMSPSHLWHNFMNRDKVKTFYDVFDTDDPMPFLFELQDKAWKKAFIERLSTKSS